VIAPTPASTRRPGGFTLAESLFAIGIISFTILAIVGVLPAALDGMQRAERRAVMQRIFQRIHADHEALPWSQLQSGSQTQTRSFDEFGIEVRQFTETGTWFTTQSRIIPGTPLPGYTSAPKFLRVLEVKITTPLESKPQTFTATLASMQALQ
jgi:uncharacterized protein (TIGR02598 family)